MSRLDWALRGTVGLYAASVLVPLAAIISVAAGSPVAGVTALVAAGGAVAVTFTVLAAAVSNLAGSVATPRVFVPLVGTPLGFLGYLLLQTPEGTLAAVAVVGLLASPVGVAVAALGATRRRRDRLADATTWVSFETDAASADGDDGFEFGRSALLAGVLLVGVGLIAFVAATAVGLVDGEVPTTLLTTLAGLSGSLAAFADDDTHEVRVTDTGIVLDGALVRRETISDAGFEDDSFVVEQAGLRPDRSVEVTEVSGAERSEIASAVDRLL